MAKKEETKQENPNLRFYEQLRQVPDYALKQIGAGRLKGMSDINPVYRIKAMTEAFGPCGIGWKYVITKQWLETYGQEVKAFCNIDLFIKVDGEWSDAIPGTGGSSLVTMERGGAYISDECVDGDCEVLTPKGWVRFADYNGKDKVCQFDNRTNELSFVEPVRFIHKKSSNLIDKGGIIMTANHRHLCFNRNKKESVVFLAHQLVDLKYKESKNGYGRSSCFQDIKWGFYGYRKTLDVLQKVGIMIACDGSLYRNNADGFFVWRCEFSKERKIEKAESLLNEAGIIYKKDIQQRANGNTTVFVFSLNNNVDYKKYSSFIPYGNYEDLWDEIISWDGCVSDHESFSTISKENALYLQTIFAMSSKIVTIMTCKDRRENRNDLFVLYKKKRNTSMIGAKKIDGEREMYCVEVPSSFFIIRKGFDILVTGNCHKMALTDALSVAMKSLGVAADVYYSKDKQGQFDTKYEQQTYVAQQCQGVTQQVQQPMQQAAQLSTQVTVFNANVQKAISATKTMDELMAVWNTYPVLTNQKEFRDAWARQRGLIEKK